VIHLTALSGGGGGSTRHRSTDSVNNPYMEGRRTKGSAKLASHTHGGPIPPGRYKINTPAQYPHLGLAARLDHPGFRPLGRDGFYIHGGPHGSDGCIVPLDHARFIELMNALTRSHGGTLVVEETADGTRYA
jgi:hypothetical protein